MDNIDFSSQNEEILYTEWVPVGKFVKAMVSLVLLLLFVSSVIVTFLDPQLLLFCTALMVSVTVFLLLLSWNFRGLRITITKNAINARYGAFNYKEILMEDVVACEIVKTGLRRYYSVGIRLGTDGSWAYSTSFGYAVKIDPREGRPFVFSTESPRHVCDLICELITHQERP